MTIFMHELRRGRTALLIWAGTISFILAICVLVYPEMSSQMGDVGGMFAEMGGFSEAFGMDRINFGEFIGFFGVECGNILGLGGAFFAALLGISALAKEEKERTAEFLLTHPVSRYQIIAGKLCAVIVQIIILNAVAICVTALSVLAIGVEVPVKTLTLLFLAYFLLQIETAAVTFGISAFLKRGGMGTGIGLAAAFYFMNIIANLVQETKFLKFITPFGYTESADIISNSAIDGRYLAVGMIFAALGAAVSFWRYGGKDIA